MRRLHVESYGPSLSPPDPRPCDHCMDDKLGEQCFDLPHCARCDHAIPDDVLSIEVGHEQWCSYGCAEQDAPTVTEHDLAQHAAAAHWWRVALRRYARHGGERIDPELGEALRAEMAFHADWAQPEEGAQAGKVT